MLHFYKNKNIIKRFGGVLILSLVLQGLLFMSPKGVEATTSGDGSILSSAEISGDTTNGPSLSYRDEYGGSVANIGDLNVDGVTDLAVGAYEDAGGGTARGVWYIHYMNTDGSIDSTVTISGSTTNGATTVNNDNYGESIAAIGDLDGDGVTEIAVSAPGYDGGKGAVYIHYMNTSGTIDSTVAINAGTSGGPTLFSADRFGSAVASLGDLDLDGVEDIAVGSPCDSHGGIYGTQLYGAFYIYYLNTDGSIDHSVKISNLTTNGPALGILEHYGQSIASLGDINADGVIDIAVGAPWDNTDGVKTGAVYIHLMNTDGTVDATSKIDISTASGPIHDGNARFGSSVAGIGDLDEDGIPDLVSGAPYQSTPSFGQTGSIDILFLNANGSPKKTVRYNHDTINIGYLSANGSPAGYGTGVAPLGDLNDDGVLDFAVGAWRGDLTNGPERGIVHLHFLDAGVLADLSLTMTVDNAHPTTDNEDLNPVITLTITVTNDGPGDANDVRVRYVLPEGLFYVSETLSQGEYSGSRWDVGDIANGDSASLSIRYTGDPDFAETTVANIAEISSVTQFDPDSIPGNLSTTEDDDASLDIFPSATVYFMHYRWRNDDGSEATATYAEDQDTPITIPSMATRRLRFSTQASRIDPLDYRLEYTRKGVSCNAPATWTQVAAISTTEAWEMAPTTNITDGDATTDDTEVLLAPGVNSPVPFDPGQIKDDTSQANDVSMTDITNASLMEYSIRPTRHADVGGVYCFRLTNAGAATPLQDSYQTNYPPQATTYAPRTLDGGATTVTFPLDDKDEGVSDAIPLPFPFYFYGAVRNNVYVAANGFVTFLPNSDSGCCSGGPLGDGGGPNALIAGYWTNLDATSAGTIKYQTFGSPGSRVFVVEYAGVEEYGHPEITETFQIILHETTFKVELQMTSVSNSGDNVVTRGVENDNGTLGEGYLGEIQDYFSLTNEAQFFVPNDDVDDYSHFAEATAGPVISPTLVNNISFGRLEAGATSDFAVSFALQGTLSGVLIVTFPVGFTVNTDPTAGASSGCLGTFGHTAQTIFATKTACSGVITLGGASVTNPSSAGSYYVSWVNDDPGGSQVYIIDSDQVTVTANVDATITMNVGSQAAATACDGTFAGNGGTVALGVLTSGAVTSSDASSVSHICTRLSTNATSGAVMTVKSLNGVDGLKSTSVPTDKIPSPAGSSTLVAGTAGYAICAGSAGVDSGNDSIPGSASPVRSSPFNGASCTSAGHNVGGLTTSAQNLWTLSSGAQNAFVRVYVKAAVSPVTAAHSDYTDTLTFIGTGTF